MIRLDPSGAFRKWLEEAGARLQTETTKALKRTSQAAATFAKLSRLYKSHTYGLRSSIQDSLLSPTHAQTSANARYASWIEDGTLPHEILPRRKKVLRFEQNGEIVFRTRVFHPGTQPRPFMHEARDKAEPLFDRLCREVVDHSFQ